VASRRASYGIAAAFLAAAMLISALVGAADLNPLATVSALLDRLGFIRLPSGLSPLDRAVLFEIRLPRIVLCALVAGCCRSPERGTRGVP